MQPVFAGTCSGHYWCAPQNDHYVCSNNYSQDCQYEDPFSCDPGETCFNRPTCEENNPSSYICNGADSDACYDVSCPAGYCPAYQVTCYWEDDAPVPTYTPGDPTPTPQPDNPEIEPSCGCCDAGDWDVDTGCWERNGIAGLQCCCGTGKCGRFVDNACLSTPRCDSDDYWFKNVCGYVTDSNTGEPVEGVKIRLTKRERDPYDSGETVWRDPVVVTTDASGKFMKAKYLNMATEHSWERMYNVMALPVTDDADNINEIVSTWQHIGFPFPDIASWYRIAGSKCYSDYSTCSYDYVFDDDFLYPGWNSLTRYQTAAITANYKKIVTSTFEDTRRIGPGLPFFNSNTPLNSIGYFYQRPLSTNDEYNEGELEWGSRDCAGTLDNNYAENQECRCNFIAVSRYDAYIVGKIEFDARFFTPEVCTGCEQVAGLSVTCDTIVADWDCASQRAFFSTEKKFSQGNSVTCTASNVPSGYHFEKVSVLNNANSIIDEPCDSDSCEIIFTVDEGVGEDGGNIVNFYLSADISGNFYLEEGSGSSESICTSENDTKLTLDNQANIYLDPDETLPYDNAQILNSDQYSYTINHYGASGFTNYLLKLEPGFTADMQTAYICNCPADCVYTGIDPAANRDFYITSLDLSNVSWFQSFGANIYAQSNIISKIPPQCIDDSACYSALQIADLDSTINSPGFPMTYAGTIQTYKDDSESYIHLAGERDLADQASAVGSQLSQLNLTYFEDKLAGEDIGDIDSFSDISEDDLSDGQLHIYQKSTSDLDIDPASTWAVSNQTQLIILVNDNINIDNTSDLDQLISVESGSFLIFIVGGDINIAPEVGYTLPATASNNPNLEGVYLADGTININSFEDTTTQDKKFIGAGTFVGWTNINLPRNYGNDSSNPISMADNNLNSTETFIYRPDFVVNFPHELKNFLSNWREVNPSWE